MPPANEASSGEPPVYGLVGSFDFFGSSDSEFGDLVHTVVDQIGGESINNEGLFGILKKKLTILEDGTLSLFSLSRGQRPDVRDVVLSEESYFDCKSSLKKELKRICQSAKIGSRITSPKDLFLLRFVFSHHEFFSVQTEARHTQDYDIFVVRHPNADFNGCRTFAVARKSGKSLSSGEPPPQEELTPISYVSAVGRICTKWETSGKRIISLMHAVVNIVPSDVKLFITTMQDVYPLSPRNSLDSYILYSKLLFHGIRLLPSSLSILVRFLVNKLISLESEIHSENPNIYTKERFEKWRQEELQTVAIKIRRGEYADINAAKSYIQDLDGLKAQFSERFTEEDIDRNAQIFDHIAMELFNFISEVHQNGLPYTKVFQSPAEAPTPSPSKGLKVPVHAVSILSSSDLESSAVEDFAVSGYGKKGEQLYKQFVDLEATILSVFETQILAIERCQFVNYIPVYLVCHYDSWCEKFLQIIFKKLFNPRETLVIRETSVDYIVSFVTNYRIVSNFKFYTPCIKYLMQFLHDFVAHWSIEKSSLNSSSQTDHAIRRSGLKRSLGSQLPKRSHLTLRNRFGLYCHVVCSLCKLFSKITDSLLSDGTRTCSFEDSSFLLDSVLNANRGLIPFILCGDLSPMEEGVDPETLVDFLSSVVRLVHRTASEHKLSISKYLGPIKVTLELLSSNGSGERMSGSQPRRFLDELRLWHSGKYLRRFQAEADSSQECANISSSVEELLKLVQLETETQVRDEAESPSQETDMPEKVYGEMESSILPDQSLWDYVWGDVPVSQEELEQDLYVTKNRLYKEDLDKQFNSSGREACRRGCSDRASTRSPCSDMSLLDTLLSSDAYKRGEAILHSYQRKHSSSKKRSKLSRKSRLI